MKKEKREYMKVYENTPYIEMKYNVIDKKITHIDNEKLTDSFRKFSYKEIVYDDHMLCCFYKANEHPFYKYFSESMIDVFKMATQTGLTVHLENDNGIEIQLALYPCNRVKNFKTDGE